MKHSQLVPVPPFIIKENDQEQSDRQVDSPDFYPVGHLQDMPEQPWSIEAPRCNPQDPTDPLPVSQCQTPQDTPTDPGPSPNKSKLFWCHEEDSHDTT